MALTDLVLEITQVDVPETIDFGDAGSATLSITNPTAAAFEGEVGLNLFISTDDDMDSESDEFNDALLTNSTSTLTIGAGESIEVVLDYESISGVIAPGNYHLLAEVEEGGAEGFDSQVVAAEGANPVQIWHAFALNAIQEFGETDNDPTGIGIEPTVGSRGLAIVQTSVFNAVNAFEGEFESYLDLDPGTPVEGAAQGAAAVGASVAALASVLPGTEDLASQIVAQLQVGFGISEAEAGELLVAAGVGDILDAPEGATIGSFYDPFLGFAGEDIEAPTAAPASVDQAAFDGFTFGVNAAVQVLEARSGDGFEGFFVGIDDPATYVPPGTFEEYVWIGEPALLPDGTSVFPDDTPFALSPGWGTLDTFTGESILTFYEAAGINEGAGLADDDGLFLDGRPFANSVDPLVDDFEFDRYVEGLEGDGGPNVLGGAAATFFGEPDQPDFGVREYGALFDTEITTIARTDNETEIAIFWAYDRADTFRPYGQLHQIAQEATFRDDDDSLIGDARVLALTSISLGEAAIAAWFAKYDEVQSRPDDVIAGDGQGEPIAGLDGSDETLVDPDFEPLLPSPPFPDFLSGHSTFAGAFGGTLEVLFPETPVDVVSQELVGNGVFTTSDDEAFNELFPAETFGQVRSFDSYLEVGFEDAISRVYGGVHVQEATDDAVLTGIEIGEFVAENFLQEVAVADDVVVGTDGDDVLLGGVDLDAIEDIVLTGAGNDEVDLALAGSGAGDNIVLAGSGEDTVAVSSDDIISGGGDNDTFVADEGSTGSRISGGAGDDTFVVSGSANSLLGGEGADTFILEGGDNIVSGGEGADSFVLGSPGDAVSNTIVDFVSGEDILTVPGAEFADLEFVDSDIILDGVTIATLAGVAATGLTAADFGEDDAPAPDVIDDVGVLAVDFDSVTLPETIAFGDTGSATIAVTNTADVTFAGDVDLELFISTDDDIDSESDEFNDAVLAAFADGLELAPGESTLIPLDYENNSGVVAPGNYHLLAEVEGGDADAGFASQVVSAPGSNPVQIWHAFALNAIQEFGETDNDPTGIGIEPTVGSRGLAIVQTSVFNAVNAFEGEFESYLDLDPGTPVEGAAQGAAAVGASVAALASVLPGTEDLASQIVAQLQVGFGISEAEAGELLVAAGVGDILDAPEGATIGSFYDPFLGFAGEDIEAPTAAPASVDQAAFDGFTFGVNAAVQVLEARSGDGFEGFFVGIDDPATYVPPGTFEEYVWIGEPALLPDGTSVFPDDTPFALSPGWGTLDTFTGESILTFYEAAGINEGAGLADDDGLFLDGRPFANSVDPLVDDFEFDRYVEGLEGDGGPNVLGGAAATFFGEPDQPDFGVREYGALFDTEITTIARTDNETEIAIFWAYDRADTFRPYGQLHQIAEEATYNDGTDDIVDDARTLALTAISLGEAAIAAWFAKYDEVQSRPDDVIAGDGQGEPIAGLDGSDETLVDPDFEPLLPSPPFPDFLSGHSTFAGAFGGTLEALFPDTPVDVVSQELVGNGVFTTSDDEAFNELFPAETFGQVRSFDSYLEVGFEDAISRVYGGVHVQEATDDAVLTGIEIGNFVAENFLQEVEA